MFLIDLIAKTFGYNAAEGPAKGRGNIKVDIQYHRLVFLLSLDP